jgi:gamma-glutamyltranspeptidase/glutathione hydrolase
MRHSPQFERNAIFASAAAVATSHPTASIVALDVLRSGGNAVDAAIAASAVLCVVEPGMTGIGGDCFAIYADRRSNRVFAINGSGPAPAAISTEALLSRGVAEIGPMSPHAVTVPGAVGAWCRLLQDFGTLSLEDVLRPAIALAESGHRVHTRVAWDWANAAERLKILGFAADSLLDDGAAPRPGDLHRHPRLAATLRRIAKFGPAGFYEGPVAENIVSVLRSLGGLHTLDDFAQYRPEYVEPIETDYCGLRVLECPPNGQGVIALMLINLLARLDKDYPHASASDRIHLLAEATKLAYRERDRLVADPRSAPVPVEEMLSPDWARRAATLIRPARAGTPQSWECAEHKDTTYLCVVDAHGNAISFINSLFDSFGSTIVAGQSGVLLHNRGKSFQLRQDSPNAISGGKRPLHTIIPGLVMRGDKPLLPFGVMGGHYQATGHAALLNNIIGRGMDVQEAVNAPRSFASDGRLRLEPMISDAIASDLADRGHVIDRSSAPMGGAQCIWLDHDRGVLIAASDPRKDGCALGY